MSKDGAETLTWKPWCETCKEEWAPKVAQERMRLEEFDIMGDAITIFGQDCQRIKAIEEMAELQKELCKSLVGADNLAEIAEEIADVQIMLDQMMMIYSCAGRVKVIRANKLRRLEQRIRDAMMEQAAEQAADPEVDHELFFGGR